MSKHQESFVYNYPISQCQAILEGVISALGWEVAERSDSRFVVKEPLLNLLAPLHTMGYPSTIEISLVAESSDRTQIAFYGHNFGFGPLQSGRIKKAISIIRERVEFAFQKITEIKTEIATAVQEGVLCPTCGKDVPPGTKFCPDDGTPIAKVCGRCNHSNMPGAKFCVNCGAEI